MVKWTVLTIAILLIAGILSHFIGQYGAESAKSLKESIRQNVQIFDGTAKLLKQKTTGSTFNISNCEFIMGAEGRAQAERECRDAIIANRTGDIPELMAQDYQHCMLDNGWLTENCKCNDKDSRCIVILSNEVKCHLSRWRTNETYVGTECKGHVPMALKKTYAEAECGITAQMYGEDKWYEGYSEFDRLLGTISTDRSCMLKKGWITSECDDDIGENTDCRLIIFRESSCLTETREWFKGTRKRRPFLEAKSWLQKSRQEPPNRQW